MKLLRQWTGTGMRRPNPVLEKIIKTLLFLTLVYKNGMKILAIHPSNMKLWELMNSYKALSQREVLVGEVSNKQQLYFPEFPRQFWLQIFCPFVRS